MELFQARVQASTPVFKRLLNQVEIAESLRISKGNNRKKKNATVKVDFDGHKVFKCVRT